MTCLFVLATFGLACAIMAVSAAILGSRRDKDIPPLLPPTEEDEERCGRC